MGQNAKNLTAGFVIAVILLLGVDGLLRASARWVPALRENPEVEEGGWYVYSADLGWTRRPNFIGFAEDTAVRFNAQGLYPRDAQDLDQPLPRIVLLGDSTTFGFRVDLEDSFGERLDALLPEAVVINLGVSGYSSYQDWRVFLAQALPLHPALVILSSNINDRRYVLDAGEVDSAAMFRKVTRWHRVRGIASRFYLYRGMRLLLLRAQTRALPTSVDLRRLPPRVSPERYRANLERIADVAHARGVRVLFLALRDNPLDTAYLREGLGLARADLIGPAEEKLDLAVRLNNFFSDLARLSLAAVYARDEDPLRRAKADEVAHTVAYRSLHGGRPVRTDEEYIDIMRQVARTRGIPVVDPGPILERDGSDYVDICHLNAKGHAKVAVLLEEAIRKEHLLPEGKGTAGKADE